MNKIFAKKIAGRQFEELGLATGYQRALRPGCILFLLAALILSACNGKDMGATETGALGGGAMGAGLGAIVGNQTGNTGAGIAIGAAVGALAGGLVGNQIDEQNVAIEQREEVLSQQERTISENQRIIDELKRRGADVRSTSRGVVVNVPDVLFEFDSAAMLPDASRAVRDIAGVVQQYPDRLVAVEGHTDSVGTIAYNQQLSEARARSVSSELVAHGVDRTRIRSRGYGESDPIASNRSEAGRRRNRRVEVIIEN